MTKRIICILLSVLICLGNVFAVSPVSTQEYIAEESTYNTDFSEETDTVGNAFVNSELIASGICGENLQWSLDNAGVLTIRGSGNMFDFAEKCFPMPDDGDIETNISFDYSPNIGTLTADGEVVPWLIYESQIEEVVVDNGVTSIGSYAFFNCGSLKEVTLPSTVESINDYAFGYSSSLASINLPDSLTYIGKYAFACCPLFDCVIEIPANVTNIGQSAFDSCDISEVHFLGGTQVISGYAFSYCKRLKKVTLPNTLTQLSSDAFNNCYALSEITIPGSLKTIPSLAFLRCTNLRTVKLSEGVEEISYFAFSSCYNIKDIYLPKTVKTIQKNDVFCLENVNIHYAGTREEWNNVTHFLQDCEDRIFFAYENGEKYSVTYNYSHNGGTEAVYDELKVESGKQANLSVTAYKEGYEHIGWNTDPDATEALSSFTVTQNTTLYAVYRKPICVRFHTLELQEPLEFTAYLYNNETQAQYTIPSYSQIFDDTEPSSSGEFKGWCDDAEECIAKYSLDETVYLDGDTDFYGIYDILWNVGVLFDNGENDEVCSPFPFDEDQIISASGAKQPVLVTLPTLENSQSFTFYGWAMNSPDGPLYNGGDSVYVYENVTFIALWNRNSIVPDPEINVSSFLGGKTVSISSKLNGCEIYYSINGAQDVLYEDEITLDNAGTYTITAQAFKDGHIDSGVVSQSILVEKVSAPVFSHSSGEYDKSFTVTLESATDDAVIFYTTDGSDPTVNGEEYADGIYLEYDSQIKAFAVCSGYVNSDVSSESFTFAEAKKPFTMLKDNYCFGNHYDYYGYPYDYRIPLERYIDVYGYTKGLQKYNNAGYWKGSCFGLSSTALIFYRGSLNYKNYSPSANCLYDVPTPCTPENPLTMLIEKYQISQYLGRIESEESYTNKARYGTARFTGIISDIIAKVDNFSKTGKNPIVLCMWGINTTNNSQIGHAVVPYKVSQNADGSYNIHIYDVNYPRSTNQIVRVSKDKKSFEYIAGSYKFYSHISYVNASTIYSQLNGGAELLAEEPETAFSVIVSSLNAKIYRTSDYVDVKNIEEAYRIMKIDGSPITTLEYKLPNDEYIIKLNDENSGPFKVSIANSSDYQEITTDDSGAAIIVGIDENTGRLYSIVCSMENSSNTIVAANASGVTNILESEGTTLGVTPVSDDEVKIETNADVSFDGTVLSYGDYNFDSVSTTLGGMESSGADFELAVKNNTLAVTSNGISGKLSLNALNNTSSVKSGYLIIAVYDSKGMFKFMHTKDCMLSLGTNYINLGELNYFGLTDNSYTMKVMLFDKDSSIKPLAENLTITIE